MPRYTIQGEDGRKYVVEGPAGATAEELGAFVLQQAGDRQKRIAAQQEADRKEYAPTVGMSTFDKLAAGAGKAVSDTGQGIGQLLGLTNRQDVAETRARDAALMDTGAGMVGNIGGNIAMTLLPGGVVGTGGKALSKVPQAAELAQALQVGGRAMMAPTSIPTAAGVGAVQGAIQPSTSTEETLRNTGVGAVASAAVPTAIRGYQIGKAALDPFREAGQRQIVGRAISSAAGTPQDAASALANLRSANAPFVGPTPDGQTARTVMGEIVPGSMPTVGQAAQNPGIAALSRTATATDSVAMNAMERRLAQQNEARVGAIEDVAGTGGRRDFMAANRDATANDLYGAARREGIDPAALTPEAQANIAAFQQRVPDEIMARARELAKINGVDMSNESSVQGLHWIKTAIDSKIGQAVTSGDKEMARAYTGLKNTLLDGMDQISPTYGEARRTFAAMSRPINEMDTAQAIADRAINPLTGNVQPQAYARALNDRTAQSVTGMKQATLENTMSPQALNRMERVQEDLARANFANTAGRGVGSDTVQKLAYTNLMDQAGIPAWATALPRGVGLGGALQRIGDLGYKSANSEMSQKLAQALLDPSTAASLMQAGGSGSPTTQLLIEALRRGGAGAGAMVPAISNANQQ